ncbi:pantoate--beta-alanine ligase [Candidatus Omnitrophota bacterium]
MKLYKTTGSLARKINEVKKKHKTVGFVPTMGFLHEGHLSLIRRARRDTDFVVVSIFVNPIQFGPKEDFKKYPRDLKRDLRLCDKIGVDIVFSVRARSMYGNGFSTYVNVEDISEGLCGATRPGHFKGVVTVVAKLFNIVKPDVAYFGQKDAQQVIVIKRMVEDLNMPIKIKTMSTIREKDGIAMSSRNTYLTPEQRKQALSIYRALKLAKDSYRKGERDSKKIIRRMRKEILAETHMKVDYISIVDIKRLRSVNRISNKALVAVAAKIGKTRLIDNVVLN